MIKQQRVIVMDVDGTLCGEPKEKGNYLSTLPYEPVVTKLKQLRAEGFYIILQSSRQMRTYEGNLGLISAHTLPTLIEWLNTHEIPYDEIHLGRPWCGHDGYYVDNKAIRPSEFYNLSHEEINTLLNQEAEYLKQHT